MDSDDSRGERAIIFHSKPSQVSFIHIAHCHVENFLYSGAKDPARNVPSKSLAVGRASRSLEFTQRRDACSQHD